MGRIIKVIFLLVVIALIGIQFIPVDRSNPPVMGEIKAPDNVKSIFRAACYDCHSNQTKWPWYSKVAPVSWLIEKHVQNGREHLNFSDWEEYDDTWKSKKKLDIWEEVNTGKMPMEMYTYLHTNAILSITQKDIIREWATKKRAWE